MVQKRDLASVEVAGSVRISNILCTVNGALEFEEREKHKESEGVRK